MSQDGDNATWDISTTDGTITPIYSSTLDFLLGGTSTTSAKFGVLNIDSGTPTASISANSGDNALYIAGDGNISTTNMQTLTLGSSTTGNVVIDSGASSITLSDNLILSGTTNVSDPLSTVTIGST